jgi:hypothetical protein
MIYGSAKCLKLPIQSKLGRRSSEWPISLHWCLIQELPEDFFRPDIRHLDSGSKLSMISTCSRIK